MERAAALDLSPSSLLLRRRLRHGHRSSANLNHIIPRLLASCSPPKPPPLSIHGVPHPIFSLSSRHLRSWIPDAPIDLDRREANTLTVRAISASECSKSESGGLLQTLKLGGLFGLWYLFTIYFNIYNKQVLKVYPFPISITMFEFVVGTVLVLFTWTTNMKKKPKVSSSQLIAILPLALVHAVGTIFTNMSIGKVAVSFTHTIKALEPFFSVLLSALFLGEKPTLWVLFSLVPIVGGVALASLTEASFNWAGFWSAMGSNLTYQSRNVLSKKCMVKQEESLDNINLFSIITIMSLFLMVPVVLLFEGFKFSPTYLQSSGLDLKELGLKALLAGICFHAYQQVAYMILAQVSPVSHSVGNCVKRVFVIAASVLFFRTPVSPVNALGTGVALAGVFLYSRVKRIKEKSV